MAKHDYLFDAKCFITIRVEADNEKDARQKIYDQVHNEGWTLDGELDLMEVDGEEPACDHDWQPEPGTHGLIDQCTKCGEDRA